MPIPFIVFCVGSIAGVTTTFLAIMAEIGWNNMHPELVVPVGMAGFTGGILGGIFLVLLFWVLSFVARFLKL